MRTLFETSTPNPAGYRDVAPRDVAAASSGARLIDVREPSELVGDLGHVAGVENVPLARLDEAALRKDEPLVLVCRSGRRSGQAAAALSVAGYSCVMNMAGGMIAWNEAGLPVER
ncbi:rhodanese-like domain-containing protein [Polyangium sp. 6x1]|uniref:rhodanese-like domain-containing protein n=1 Tax=Polyangium sp. 6x1 TaxID=3042689 RepID=UPI0024831701|nr:rhodanese-like domain-containing protein [Polyangium sp. 6x1]MDI1449788.1 rhodanese-like domain-containing protein [Polyangium sp. 6x1]